MTIETLTVLLYVCFICSMLWHTLVTEMHSKAVLTLTRDLSSKVKSQYRTHILLFSKLACWIQTNMKIVERNSYQRRRHITSLLCMLSFGKNYQYQFGRPDEETGHLFPNTAYRGLQGV
jgi:hypothetical protein